MSLFCSARRYVYLAVGLMFLILSGCNPEARLAAAADNGDVMAQYELAIYYSELEPPQKTKSYEWMKRAAVSRYSPAMKKLAEYYLTGYGTPINYPRVAEWLTRYFEKDRDSTGALKAGKQILSKAVSHKGVAAGIILCNIALTIENQNGDATSDIALDAANTISSCTRKVFYRLLDSRSYADAEKLLQFSQKIHREYPNSFKKGMQLEFQQMQTQFIAKLQGN